MNYLNVKAPSILFRKTLNSEIYVDKSLLIQKLNKAINTQQCYICVTRPRRFGKTINANMLGAYYTKGYDSHPLFDHLNIAKTASYEKHLNQHHVIYINFSRIPDPCDNYMQYIDYIKMQLLSDLQEVYGIEKQPSLSINDYLISTNDSFIFILDEL